MKYAVIILLIMSSQKSQTIYNFSLQSDTKSWTIVDDVVMGGRSSGNFTLTSEGFGQFSGSVSLENNGGFSSVRHNFNRIDVQDFSSVKIKLKGDGKNYQFRIKENASDYFSYITTFQTNGEWQEIKIALIDLYPSFRGRKLDKPNFAGTSIEELAFLIANAKNESFELVIDSIELI